MSATTGAGKTTSGTKVPAAASPYIPAMLAAASSLNPGRPANQMAPGMGGYYNALALLLSQNQPGALPQMGQMQPQPINPGAPNGMMSAQMVAPMLAQQNPQLMPPGAASVLPPGQGPIPPNPFLMGATGMPLRRQ